MTCRDVDELGAAFALGAVDAAERDAIVAHLATCREPHAELRGAIGAGVALASGLEPLAPSAQLRQRVLATVAATAQEATGLPAAPPTIGFEPRQPSAERPASAMRLDRRLLDWLTPPRARGLAGAGIAATLVLAILTGWLYRQLDDRDAVLRAAATAIAGGGAAYRVEGEAGRGYLVDSLGPGATLVVADLRDLPEHLLYELWLVPADGAPVAAGTFVPSGEALAVIEVEGDLEGYTLLAVTVERERVEAPTSEPVLVAPLEG